MDFEQLHLRTVELLAAKVAEYGLPESKEEELDDGIISTWI